MTFGQKIKKLRMEKEWTQSYVGKQIGVSDRVLGYYESDNRFPKDEKILKALASLYNVTVDYLLGESQHENGNKALIPVLGTVQAGIPIEAVQDIIDYEELNPEMLEHGEE